MAGARRARTTPGASRTGACGRGAPVDAAGSSVDEAAREAVVEALELTPAAPRSDRRLKSQIFRTVESLTSGPERAYIFRYEFAVFSAGATSHDERILPPAASGLFTPISVIAFLM